APCAFSKRRRKTRQTAAVQPQGLQARPRERDEDKVGERVHRLIGAAVVHRELAGLEEESDKVARPERVFDLEEVVSQVLGLRSEQHRGLDVFTGFRRQKRDVSSLVALWGRNRGWERHRRASSASASWMSNSR